MKGQHLNSAAPSQPRQVVQLLQSLSSRRAVPVQRRPSHRQQVLLSVNTDSHLSPTATHVNSTCYQSSDRCVNDSIPTDVSDSVVELTHHRVSHGVSS